MDYATTATGRSQKPILGSAIGARAIMDGREVIVLGSNNYLGLANHPEVIARAKEALDKYGAGPALNPPLATTPLHEALCAALARFHRTESALLFNSWLYFGLNYAFFRFPWPWAEWTSRTPNGIIFTVCVLGLTGLALLKRDMTFSCGDESPR